MTNDVDFDGTVDEVKDQIRDLEDPDYQELLEQEENGKDRKTIKEFIQKRMDSAEVEIDDEETEDSAEETVEEDLVEEIEEETDGGLLGGLSPQAVLGAGLLGGLVIGLMLGLVFQPSAADAEITPDEAQDRVESLIGLQLDEDDYKFTAEPEVKNGMYYVQTEITQEVPSQDGNETESQEVEHNFYLTTDGELLLREQVNPRTGQLVNPIDIDAQIEEFDSEPEIDPEDLEEDSNSTE